MKRKFEIEVDCANCAQKIEDALNKLEEVNSAKINFMFRKLTLEANNIDDVLVEKILQEGKKVDDDFEIKNV